MSSVCPPCDIVLYWSTRVSYYCTLVSYQVCTYDPPYAVAYSYTYTYSTLVLGTPYLVQVPIENHGDAAIGTRQYRGVLRESHTLQYCTNYWQQASYSIVLQVQGTEKNLVKQIPWRFTRSTFSQFRLSERRFKVGALQKLFFVTCIHLIPTPIISR